MASSSGGRRGRPTRMERLRREIVAEGAGAAAAEERIALPARKAPRVGAAPGDVAQAIRIPAEVWDSLGKSMGASAYPPLAKTVNIYAEQREPFRACLSSANDSFYNEIWDPSHNTWHTTSLQARSQKLDMDRKTIQLRERCAAAAAELTERHGHMEMQVAPLGTARN